MFYIVTIKMIGLEAKIWNLAAWISERKLPRFVGALRFFLGVLGMGSHAEVTAHSM